MFGYWKACPEDTKGAWGARVILRSGYVDILHDRQGFKGEAHAICAKMNAGILDCMKNKVKELWDRGELDPREDREHVLCEDDEIRVVGNTNGSCGYLYLLAYLK